MSKKITKKSTFKELIKEKPEAIPILLEKGMHCIGCPMASQETIEQGSLAHNLDPDELLKEIFEE